MNSLDRKDVTMRLMTDDDYSKVLSLDWAQIPEKEMFASRKGGRPDASFVAEVGSRPVGFVLARIIYVSRPMTGVCQLHLIAVRPDYQNRGIGSMMLDSIHDYCKTQDIHTIRALVNQDDNKLTEYFGRLGFQPSKKINMDITWD